MRNLLLLALFICHFHLLNAQIFFKQDSAHKKSIFQIELGGYYGIQHIKPITPGFTYDVNDGIDKGVMANVITNITPSISLGLSLRSVTQTAMIGIYNDALGESFLLTMPSYQKLVFLNYNFTCRKKDILQIGLGLGSLEGTYFTSNDFYDIYKGSSGTVRGIGFINEINFKYTTYTLMIKKNFKLMNQLALSPFIEVEARNTPLVKENSSNNQKYFSEFQLLNSRIGICLTLF